MQRISLIVLALWAVSHPAWAADYCYTSTAKDDAAIAIILDRVNAHRAEQDPPKPALTADQYVGRRFADVVQNWRQQIKAERNEAIRTGADAASDAVLTKIQNLLTCEKVSCD